MDKGYLKINGNPQIETNFRPYQVYTNNGNYLKVNFKLYLLNNTYFWGGDNGNWFSFEKGFWGTYPNFGSTIAVFNVESTIFTSNNECSMILDNGSVSLYLNGEYLTGGTFNGTLQSSPLKFFFNGGDSSYNMDFYHFEIYDRNNVLQYNIIGGLDNGVAKLKDDVSGTFFSSVGGSMEYVRLIIFEPSKSVFNFSSIGGSESFNIIAYTGWTATTASDWVSLDNMTGTTGGTLVLTYNPNASDSARTATITFTDADANTFDITINQKKRGVWIPKAKVRKGALIVSREYWNGSE